LQLAIGVSIAKTNRKWSDLELDELGSLGLKIGAYDA
jgi:hypothetical protein